MLHLHPHSLLVVFTTILSGALTIAAALSPERDTAVIVASIITSSVLSSSLTGLFTNLIWIRRWREHAIGTTATTDAAVAPSSNTRTESL